MDKIHIFNSLCKYLTKLLIEKQNNYIIEVSNIAGVKYENNIFSYFFSF